MQSTSRCSGLVQMAQFAAQASWSNAGRESIEIQFRGELLSKQQLVELGRFRSRTRSLLLQVPGCSQRQATIVGFQAPKNRFYLAFVKTPAAPKAKAQR